MTKQRDTVLVMGPAPADPSLLEITRLQKALAEVQALLDTTRQALRNVECDRDKQLAERDAEVERLSVDVDNLQQIRSTLHATCDDYERRLAVAEPAVAARDSALARVKELEAERASFNDVLAKTNAALNRAGCYSALFYWEHIDSIAAERNALKSKLASAEASTAEAIAAWLENGKRSIFRSCPILAREIRAGRWKGK